MKNRGLLLIVILAVAVYFPGCAAGEAEPLVEIKRDMYQKTEYQTVQAYRGDMKPTLSLTLRPLDVEKIDYAVYEDDLQVDEVFVNVGDYVTAGQKLITFESEDIRKNIEKYNSELTQKQLLLEHYIRLYDIDTKDRDNKYGIILQKLQDDVELSKLYLEEEQQRLEKCQLVAKRDGVITYLSNHVLGGYAKASQKLITESCGRNQFVAGTNDSYDFQVGDVYPAEYRGENYEMAVVEIMEEEANERTIVFEPVDVVLNAAASDTLDMTIKKETLLDVVYVDKRAVHFKKDEAFVYVVNEKGFLDAVYVNVAAEENGMAVVVNGLEGTEKVAIK